MDCIAGPRAVCTILWRVRSGLERKEAVVIVIENEVPQLLDMSSMDRSVRGDSASSFSSCLRTESTVSDGVEFVDIFCFCLRRSKMDASTFAQNLIYNITLVYLYFNPQQKHTNYTPDKPAVIEPPET